VGLSDLESRGSREFGHSADFQAPKPKVDDGVLRYGIVQGILAVAVVIATLAVAMTIGDFDRGGFGFSRGAAMVVAGGLGSFVGGIVGFKFSEAMPDTAVTAIARGMIVTAISFCIAAAPFVFAFVVGLFYAFVLGVQMFGTQAFAVSIVWSLTHWAKYRVEAGAERPVRNKYGFWIWLIAAMAMLVMAVQASIFYAKFI
jgi:hypothetical protein